MVGNAHHATGAEAGAWGANTTAGACPHPRTEHQVVVATAAELVYAVSCPDCDLWLDTEISPHDDLDELRDGDGGEVFG